PLSTSTICPCAGVPSTARWRPTRPPGPLPSRACPRSVELPQSGNARRPDYAVSQLAHPRMTAARRLVFYRTLAVDENARCGSAGRPAGLVQAFRRLWCDVDVVAGTIAARRKAMAQFCRNLQAGVQYDFMYAEPPTTPVMLNERHHMPTHPLLDYLFLRSCHIRMPVLLFYSDVQWRLPGYGARIGLHKYLFALPFFHLDLAVYARVVDAVLVPDRGMLSQIPGLPASKPAWVSLPGFDPDEHPLPRVERAGVLRL